MKIAIAGLFVLALAGCKPTETVEPTIAAPVSPAPAPVHVVGQPKEVITFRDLPFEEGDVRQSLRDMCVADAKQNAKYRTKVDNDDWWCVLKGKRPLLMFPELQYGNLRESAVVFMNETGGLAAVMIDAPTKEVEGLASLLQEKYGEPAVSDSQVTIGVLRNVSRRTFSWTDPRGNSIRIATLGEKLGEGNVEIQSAAYTKLLLLEEQQAKAANKSKL